MRRNFQGYTDDTCVALVGLGASAISRLPQGHAQNAPSTSGYQGRIKAGTLAVERGFALTLEDRLRARAIEMLMCSFRIDLVELARDFGTFAELIAPACRTLAAQFEGDVTLNDTGFTILPQGRPLTRIIAAGFDAYAATGGRHSQAV